MNLLEICNDYQNVWVEIGSKIVEASDPMTAQGCWTDMVKALEPVFANRNSADVAAAVAVYLAYISFELAKEVKNVETGENVPPGVCLMALANMANSNLVNRPVVKPEKDHGKEESDEEKSDEEEGS